MSIDCERQRLELEGAYKKGRADLEATDVACLVVQGERDRSKAAHLATQKEYLVTRGKLEENQAACLLVQKDLDASESSCVTVRAAHAMEMLLIQD
eukprot:3871972-Prymnesium_polylepis.1